MTQLWPRVLVYVAAPFSPTERQLARPSTGYFTDVQLHAAYLEENKDNAARLGLSLARFGVMPVVPHTAHGGRPELEHVQNYKFWIEATEELLLGCDACLLAPNWQESKGAMGEYATCIDYQIPVFTIDTDLRAWAAKVDYRHLLTARADRLNARIAAHHDTIRPPALPADFTGDDAQ